MPRIKFALRSLSKAPLVSLAVVVSLGLGIGANTAIYSLLNQVLLASLPVPRPAGLALFTTPGAPKSGSVSMNESGGADYIFSYRAFREFEKRPEGLTGAAAFRDDETNVSLGGHTASASILLVSGGYFSVLEVRPAMGRILTASDDLEGGGNPVVVASFYYWRDKMGARADALNQPVRINGRIFTVVGVTPEGFRGTTLGKQPDLFLPLSLKTALEPGWKGQENYNEYWLYMIGRLKQGVSLQQASAALNPTYAALVDEQLQSATGADANYVRHLRESRLALADGRQGHSSIRDEGKTPLIILMVTTAMVLLIAMANAANLLLARSAERRKEIAIRTALGAGRGQIMGQSLTEAILLAAGGGVLGWR